LQLNVEKSMRQRGRKSADNVVALAVNGESPRLEPPPTLTDPERRLFVEIVAACKPTHFVPERFAAIGSLC
jgi:hypothetical protein